MRPETWPKREKRRKKWKDTILQEMGELSLENGSVAEVKIRIEKEGYIFILAFDDDEDGYMNFPDTKMFKKEEWMSGDE